MYKQLFLLEKKPVPSHASNLFADQSSLFTFSRRRKYVSASVKNNITLADLLLRNKKGEQLSALKYIFNTWLLKVRNIWDQKFGQHGDFLVQKPCQSYEWVPRLAYVMRIERFPSMLARHVQIS